MPIRSAFEKALLIVHISLTRVTALMLVIAAGVTVPGRCDADDVAPRIHDDSLQVTLFARDPLIVTPIGVAAHPQGGMLVVESHTHSPPKDYPGPSKDRILWLRDTSGDGQADRRDLFADGFDDAMNVIISRVSGSSKVEAFVIQRSGVVRLEDRTGDGLADDRETIVRLETPETYDHSTLLGLCMDDAGKLYLSRGNTGGNRFRWVGNDGSGYSGHGDGGDVVVTDRNGHNVRRFATGFWNPFGLHWDRRGWLLCSDNDPDAVGPNRVVHLVPGGDYGFRSAYGSAGNWPLSAWNGELPGTLPILAGVGEAPGTLCSAIDADLPAGYEQDIFVAVWGEHRVDRIQISTTPQGMRGVVQPWIQGDTDFRPVAVTAGIDGAIYITDWVRKDYPNHGEGRIWRVRRRDRDDAASSLPSARFVPAPVERDPYVEQLESVASQPTQEASNISEFKSADPFVRAAGIWAWASAGSDLRGQTPRHRDPQVRLGVLLAMRRGGDTPEDVQFLRWLSDRDVEVRIAALSWIADSRRAELRSRLARALLRPPIDARLVQVYLAADQAISPQMIDMAEEGKRWMGVRRQFDPQTIDDLLDDPTWNDDVVAALLSVAGPPQRKAIRQAVLRSLSAPSRPLRREAIHSLGQVAEEDERLLAIAMNPSRDIDDRADAIAYLPRQTLIDRGLKLLQSAHPPVVVQTLRALRDVADQAPVLEAVAALEQRHAELSEVVAKELQQWPRADGVVDRPADWEQWKATLASDGDAEAGRRAFFSDRAQCSRCHQCNGRGGGVGPNLSGTGSGHSSEQLLRALLYPSEGIAPEYASHTILTNDGQVHTGIQFHFRSGGSHVSILTMEGKELSFPLSAVETYRANPQSMMPEDLVNQLSVGEVRDIIAMLSESLAH